MLQDVNRFIYDTPIFRYLARQILFQIQIFKKCVGDPVFTGVDHAQRNTFGFLGNACKIDELCGARIGSLAHSFQNDGFVCFTSENSVDRCSTNFKGFFSINR